MTFYNFAPGSIPDDWRLMEGLNNDMGAAPPDPDALQRLQLRHASTVSSM